MCGRFSLSVSAIQQLAERFETPTIPFELRPRYNFAPTQETLAIVNLNNSKKLMPMTWGFFPYWSQGKAKPYPLFNVRSENLIEKPLFKPYFERQRCLIPADGFFEWRQEGSRKIPYRAVLKNENIFAFAGLWEQRISSDSCTAYSFAILTTEANSLVYAIHDRMPVILSKEDETLWLNPALYSIHELKPLMRSYPSDKMSLYQVSSDVNSTKNDSPKCIVPVHTSSSESLF